MVIHIVVAISLVLIGFFVCVFFSPNRRIGSPFVRRWLRLDTVKHEDGAALMKRADRVALYYSFAAAFVTLLDGILHTYLGLPDIKEAVLVITVLSILPLRYFYIQRKRK